MVCREAFRMRARGTFPSTKWRQNGFVLASPLFSIMFSAMLSGTHRDHDIEVGIRYRTDGNLFNLRILQARTKVQEETIGDLLFVDDCALNDAAQSDMQEAWTCSQMPLMTLASPFVQRQLR